MTSLLSSEGALFFVEIGCLKAPCTGVVFELIREVIGVGGDVDDAHDVNFLAEQVPVAKGLEDRRAIAEAIDATRIAILVPPSGRDRV